MAITASVPWLGMIGTLSIEQQSIKEPEERAVPINFGYQFIPLTSSWYDVNSNVHNLTTHFNRVAPSGQGAEVRLTRFSG